MSQTFAKDSQMWDTTMPTKGCVTTWDRDVGCNRNGLALESFLHQWRLWAGIYQPETDRRLAISYSISKHATADIDRQFDPSLGTPANTAKCLINVLLLDKRVGAGLLFQHPVQRAQLLWPQARPRLCVCMRVRANASVSVCLFCLSVHACVRAYVCM